MYSGNNNKLVSSLDNTITVTPIKMDVDMSHVYPTTSNALSTAGATSMRATNTISVMSNAPSTATSKEKSSKQPRVTVHKTPPTIDNFWPNIVSEVKNIQQVDAKHQALPLARIKKIMKLDENAKMIAAEAPLLFAKACEYFIQELTMRAWVHTEDNKRRTLQRSDIAQAIANYDQFDFLIDIVPREDIKPSSSSSSNAASQNTKKDTQPPASAATSVSTAMPTNTIKLETPQMLSYGTLTSDALAAAAQQQLQQQPTQQLQILQQTASPAQPQQLQYFITIPGQQHGQHQLVQQLQLQQPQLQQQLPNGLTLTTTAGNPQLAGLNIVTPQPQQLILTAGPNGQLTATPAPTAATTQQQQQTALLQNLAHQQHQQQQQQQQQQQLGNQQQIQLLHQVISPTGELTNVPISITANQLNLLRLQMQQQQQQQQQQQHQQVIIPAHCVTAGAAQQMLQLGAGGNVAAAAPNANANTNATIQLGQVQITHYPQQQQQQQQQQQHQQQQQQQQHQQQQHQQQQNSASGGPNIYLNTGQQQNPNSVVSTDRNLNSTYRTNC